MLPESRGMGNVDVFRLRTGEVADDRLSEAARGLLQDLLENA